jgi:hypothetical protein
MQGKKILFVLAIALFLIWGGVGSRPLAAQTQPILPSSFGAWTASGAVTQVPPAQIEQLASDSGPVLREYGIASGERREYANGDEKLTVTLYGMVDPSAAFGAFTFLRDSDMPSLAARSPVSYGASSKGAAAEKGGDGGQGRTLLVVGNLLLDVASAKSSMAAADASALGQSVVGRADRRPYPPIAEFLPKDGLVPGSERYVLGPLALSRVFPPAAANPTDWAGFGSSAEAMVGRYKFPGKGPAGEGLLLLILYPTQQLAADRYTAMGKSFALNVDPGVANGRLAMFATRSSALIALLSGVESREAASHFLGQIHYASLVTWDAPTHDITDPSISTIVVGAIVDTGAIMLLVMAASLGFGGFRLLAKLLAPGKIFDRTADVEILQLGINSKPVEVKDFYVLQTPR